MWTRTDEIPEGWVECDGTNGTPDLRGYILSGKTDTGIFSTLNSNVGNNTTILETKHLPQHSHSINQFYQKIVDRYHPTKEDDVSSDKFPVLNWGSYSHYYHEGKYYSNLQFDTHEGDHCFIDRAGQPVSTNNYVKVPGATNNTGGSEPFSVVQPVHRLTFIMKINEPLDPTDLEPWEKIYMDHIEGRYQFVTDLSGKNRNLTIVGDKVTLAATATDSKGITKTNCTQFENARPAACARANEQCGPDPMMLEWDPEYVWDGPTCCPYGYSCQSLWEGDMPTCRRGTDNCARTFERCDGITYTRAADGSWQESTGGPTTCCDSNNECKSQYEGSEEKECIPIDWTTDASYLVSGADLANAVKGTDLTINFNIKTIDNNMSIISMDSVDSYKCHIGINSSGKLNFRMAGLDYATANRINTGDWVAVSIKLGSAGNDVLINGVKENLSYYQGNASTTTTIPDIDNVKIGITNSFFKYGFTGYLHNLTFVSATMSDFVRILVNN
jgi:microcystin-dependent protein